MTQERTAGTSAWAGRWALLAAVCAVPLFAFGGAVTTLEAGLAVEGWWNAEGHFLPFFPVEKWLRNPETFVEHTHRLFGMLVGLAALAALLSCLRARLGRGIAGVALLAVCIQGTLGGLRVLEESSELAFLHGVFGQGVFALLAASALLLSARWSAPRAQSEAASLPTRMAWTATGVVYLQIALGAWYRHGLRPVEVQGVAGRLGLHLMGALLVLGVIAALAARLRASGRPELRAIARQLHLILGLQLVLGALSWIALSANATGMELVVSVLHVLCGALLLARTATSALWCARLGRQESAPLLAELGVSS